MNFPICIKTFGFISSMIKFYYPMICCMKNFTVQNKINYEIYNFTMKFIANLKYLDMPTYISGGYEVKTNERDVLIVNFTGLGDFKGAHPINSVKSLNIDTKNGEIYKLKDLFKQDSNYIKILSSIGDKEIKEQKIVLYENGYKGVRPDQDYFIADKNLIIYFQQYEIGPRTSGFPYFSVPIYKIDDIVDKNSIFGRMIEFL